MSRPVYVDARLWTESWIFVCLFVLCVLYIASRANCGRSRLRRSDKASLVMAVLVLIVIERFISPHFVAVIVSLLVVRGCAQLYEPVEVDYLGGEQRLRRGDEWDFYYCCNAEGPSLQWVINETGYRVFHPGELHRIIGEPTETFNYTSTLLSSKQAVGTGNYHLDSILIVSVLGNITVEVQCVSGTNRNFANNRKRLNSNLRSNSSSDVVLFKLWERPIVRSLDNAFANTSCFLCGGDFSSQTWQTNEKDQLGLDTMFSLPKQLSIPSTADRFVRLRTILFAKFPTQLVSIFLVTDSSVSSVSCSAGGTSVHLSVEDTNPAEIEGTNPGDVDLMDTQHIFETITTSKWCQFH